MTQLIRTKLPYFGLIAILFLAACGGQNNAAPAADTPSETSAAAESEPADLDSVVAAVMEEVQAVLAADKQAVTTTDEAGADVASDEIAAAVLAEVQAELANQEQVASPEVTVDTDALAEEITAEVLSRLEGQLAAQNQALQLASDASEGMQSAGIILQDALVRLYEQANPAVVFVIVAPIGTGSGFVYSDEGYIVTNNHVVADQSEFEVVFANGERRRAELVGADVDSDLAVIKVDDLPDGVTPLPLAAADDLVVGQFVVAIGNPFGEQGSMSLGIVSGLDRSLPSQRDTGFGSSYSLPSVIQTDAPINPGNSGGPLLNLNGEVVGINSAISTTTGTNSGVGFSIPVAAVRRIVPSLIADGVYVYPYMGASFDGEISLDDQAAFDLSQTTGAYVFSVTEGSPAEQAGLQPADPNTGRGGDLIVALDGVPVNDFSDLNNYLSFYTSPGQTVTVTVIRDGESVELQLTLGARP